MGDFAYPWCPKCGDNFPMRQDVYDGMEECGNTFYCPQGHALTISRASIVSQLRTAKRRADYRSNAISRLQKHTESLRGVQTRQRNRLLRGACPYCNTTPRDMTKHMKERHGPKVN